MKIGLFGGSFNPPHAGHELVSQQVLKRLGLDEIWWLVTPGNPLKDHGELAPLQQRVKMIQRLASHPKARVSGFEALRGFTHSHQTLKFLQNILPGRYLTWIMGADSFADFHRWERWREICGLMPLVIYDRPGAGFRALSSPAASYLKKFRIDERDAGIISFCRPPAWIYLGGLTSEISSSRIRQNFSFGKMPLA